MKARRPDSFFQTLAGRPFFLPSLVGLFLLGAILLLAFFPKTRSLPLFRHLIGNTPEQVAEAYLDRMKDGNIRRMLDLSLPELKSKIENEAQLEQPDKSVEELFRERASELRKTYGKLHFERIGVLPTEEGKTVHVSFAVRKTPDAQPDGTLSVEVVFREETGSWRVNQRF